MIYKPRWAAQFDGTLDRPSSFAYASEPPAGWVPFAAGSPWNTPIGVSPAVAADSAAVIARLNEIGKPMDRWIGVGGSSSDFEHPRFYSAPADPTTRIKIKAGQRDPSVSETAEANLEARKRRVSPIHNRVIPMPAKAAPAGGSDAHLAIVTATHSYEMWKAKGWTPGEGRYGASAGAVFDLSGDGRSQSGHAATASGVSLLAGAVRLCEIEAGHIPHALAICTRWVRAGVFNSAIANGAASKDPVVTAGDANDLKYAITGSRLQLNMTATEIQVLGRPAWITTILEAMREYGMIVIDTSGGTNTWWFQFESGGPDVAFGNTDRWATFGAAKGLADAHGLGGPAGSRVLSPGEWADWSKLQVLA